MRYMNYTTVIDITVNDVPFECPVTVTYTYYPESTEEHDNIEVNKVMLDNGDIFPPDAISDQQWEELENMALDHATRNRDLWESEL